MPVRLMLPSRAIAAANEILGPPLSRGLLWPWSAGLDWMGYTMRAMLDITSQHQSMASSSVNNLLARRIQSPWIELNPFTPYKFVYRYVYYSMLALNPCIYVSRYLLSLRAYVYHLLQTPIASSRL